MSAPTIAVRRGGRPRDPSRDDAILDAVITVLAEDGLNSMTMDGVAAVARAGKATVYRRWSSRSHLIAEALVRRAPEVSWEEAPHRPLHHDVGAVVVAFTCTYRAHAAMAVLSELPHDAQLRDAYTAVRALASAIDELQKRAVGRGQVFRDAWAPDIEALVLGLQVGTLLRGRSPGPILLQVHVDELLTRLDVGRDA